VSESRPPTAPVAGRCGALDRAHSAQQADATRFATPGFALGDLGTAAWLQLPVRWTLRKNRTVATGVPAHGQLAVISFVHALSFAIDISPGTFKGIRSLMIANIAPII
jgi:hypothetical protein